MSFAFDQQAFMRDVAKIMAIQGRTFEDVIKDQCRNFVADAIAVTPPFSKIGDVEEGNQLQKSVGTTRVEKDIRKAFISFDDFPEFRNHPGLEAVVVREYASGCPPLPSRPAKPGQPAKRRDRSTKDTLYAGIMRCEKAGNHSKSRELLGKSGLNVQGIIERPTRELHNAARNKKGRVSRGMKWLVNDSKSIKSFIKEMQGSVGIAKSGWVKPAERLLEGMGRSSRLAQKLGKWITRHSNAGVYEESGSGSDQFAVTVGNGVPFIQRAKTMVDEYAWYVRSKKIAAQVDVLLSKSRKAFDLSPLTSGAIH